MVGVVKEYIPLAENSFLVLRICAYVCYSNEGLRVPIK
jgi:hypothetical protein